MTDEPTTEEPTNDIERVDINQLTRLVHLWYRGMDGYFNKPDKVWAARYASEEAGEVMSALIKMHRTTDTRNNPQTVTMNDLKAEIVDWFIMSLVAIERPTFMLPFHGYMEPELNEETAPDLVDELIGVSYRFLEETKTGGMRRIQWVNIVRMAYRLLTDDEIIEGVTGTLDKWVQRAIDAGNLPTGKAQQMRQRTQEYKGNVQKSSFNKYLNTRKSERRGAPRRNLP